MDGPDQRPGNEWTIQQPAAAGVGAGITGSDAPAGEPRPRWLVPALAGLFILVVLVSGWICDDAYIIYRVADNAVNGFGLRWNVVERVQVYTCPLWTLLFTGVYWLTREAYFTGLALSIAVSLAAFWLVVGRGALTAWGVVVAGLVLTVSKAFVDYSTSGLENPLSNLLVGVFALRVLTPGGEGQGNDRRVLAISLLASLLALTRMDLGLVAAPVLAYELIRSRRWRTAGVMALGQTPLALWCLFALVYYGFVFPNTAYAKLNSDWPAHLLARQGLVYLLNSLVWDPVTLLTIALGIACGVWAAAHRRWPAACLALGAVFYLAYIVKIGGDFMSGRFLTAPLVVSLILLLRSAPALPRGVWIGTAVGAAALGLVVPRSPIRNTVAYGDRHLAIEEGKQWGGVTDERRFYAFGLSVLDLVYEPRRQFHITRSPVMEQYAQIPPGTVLVAPNIGIRGYATGPQVHHVDVLALADPLLARLLPLSRTQWRAGHLPRAIPVGYVEGLESGQNLIADPDLAQYYDRLCVITRGPIWSGERWRTILKMHLGAYDGLIHHDRYRE